MFKSHPQEHVYANILAGHNMEWVKDRGALDYWGLSYKEALDYILENDKRDSIKLRVPNPPGKLNAFLLQPEEKKRLRYVKDPLKANYILTNYRNDFYRIKFSWKKLIGRHSSENGYFYQNEYFTLKSGNQKYMTVFKMPD